MFVWTVQLIMLMPVIVSWAGRTRAAGLATGGGARLHQHS